MARRITFVVTTVVVLPLFASEENPPISENEVSLTVPLVVICHKNRTITVSQQAVQRHLAHGDTLGPCDGDCLANDDCETGQFCEKEAGDCDGEGACSDIPEACPEVFDPVCGCDGVTYGNACFAAMAGVNVAFAGPCDAAECTTSDDCPEGTFCQKELGDCNGVGSCAEVPQVCPEIFDPVCGCDGMTYSNACFAAMAGVSIAFPGPCAVGFLCMSNDDCADGEFCMKFQGDCDGLGLCAPTPDACPEIFDPVCGCDGMTYSNACFAAMAGVSVAFPGTCPDQDCGADGQPCPQGLTCFNGCGVLIQGVECILFQADAGPLLVLDNIAGFGVGDQVQVSGCFDPGCVSICLQGDGCLFGNTIEPCPGEICGGIMGIPCPEGQFCMTEPGQCCCDFQGVCTTVPEICLQIFDPVCGCDGMTYSNACFAAAAGVNVDCLDACPCP